MNTGMWVWLGIGYLVIDVLLSFSKYEGETGSLLALLTVNLFWPIIAIIKGCRCFAKWIPMYCKSVVKQIKNI